MKLSWSENAWSDYEYWQTQDKKKQKRINQLIKDIMRNGAMEGIGKPEPLKYRKGYSRRIDDTNHLYYDVVEDELIIYECRGHYED